MIKVGKAYWPKGCQGSTFFANGKHYLDPKLKFDVLESPERWEPYEEFTQELAQKLYD